MPGCSGVPVPWTKPLSKSSTTPPQNSDRADKRIPEFDPRRCERPTLRPERRDQSEPVGALQWCTRSQKPNRRRRRLLGPATDRKLEPTLIRAEWRTCCCRSAFGVLP